MDLVKVKNDTQSFLHVNSLNKSLAPGQTMTVSKMILESDMEVIECIVNGLIVICEDEDPMMKPVEKPVVKQAAPKEEPSYEVPAEEKTDATVMTPNGPLTTKMRNYTAEMGMPNFIDQNDVIQADEPEQQAVEVAEVVKVNNSIKNISASDGLDDIVDDPGYSDQFLDDFKEGEGESKAFVD